MDGLPHYVAIQRHAPEEAVAFVESALSVGVVGVEKDVVGASHATYFMRLDDGREVVARIAIHPGHDLARDLWATETCRRLGVPAPEVLAAQTDSSAGTPFAVLSRLPGQAAHAAHLVGREREGVLEQMGAYLTLIHGMALTGYGELRPAGESGTGYVGSAELLFEVVLAGVGQTLGELDQLRSNQHWPARAFSAVTSERVRATFMRGRDVLDLPRAVLVHGDFRLKNALVLGSDVTGIVDYELAAAGDPAMDLAWLRVEDVTSEGEWRAVCRGYGLTVDAEFEHRLRLYELRWILRRMWWEVMTGDTAGVTRALAAVDRLLCSLEG